MTASFSGRIIVDIAARSQNLIKLLVSYYLKVWALEPRKNSYVICTNNRDVRANTVVICTSPCQNYVNTKLYNAILPIGISVPLTEPLFDRLTEAIRSPYAVLDNRMVENYYRPLRSTQILWGEE